MRLKRLDALYQSKLLRRLDALYDYKPKALVHLTLWLFLIMPLAFSFIDRMGGYILLRLGIAPPFAVEVLSTAVLWATGFTILLYTLETHDLRREMARQNEISIQPVLIAIIKLGTLAGVPGPQLGRQIVLRNIGRGAALFVRIRDLIIHIEGQRRYVIRFDMSEYIEPGEERPIAGVLHREGDADRPYYEILDFLRPETAVVRYDVTVAYQDTAGQERESVVWMGEGGIRLVRQGKV